MKAIRKNLEGADMSLASNASLLLSRYMEEAVSQEKGKSAVSRDSLLRAAQRSTKNVGEVYALAFERYQSSLPKQARVKNFTSKGRIIIGLSGDSAMETSIALLHTYGLPYIPASAIKGLASHYAHQVWGQEDKLWCVGGDYHNTVFGNTEAAGFITFYDAWIDPNSLNQERSCMRKDILTPHHGDYYMAGSTPDQSKDIPAPTDFDDPNPANTFLTAVGSFSVALSCEDNSEQGNNWIVLVFTMLEQAFANWGVGGKTSSGYGRLVAELLPEELWFNDTVASIMNQHNSPKKETILGKNLANCWNEIADEQFKAKCLALIKRWWEEQAKQPWDAPPCGKSNKQAKKIYTGSV